MQLRITLQDDRDEPGTEPTGRDLVLTCPAGATAGQVWQALGCGSEDPIVDGLALSPEHPVGRVPLVDGAVVHLPAAGWRPGAASPGVFLVAVAGPAAGHRLALPPGRHLLGRQTRPDLPDPNLSRIHLEFRVSDGTVQVRDTGSTNGSFLDGEPLGPAPVLFRPGQRLQAGGSTLQLRLPPGPPRPLPESDGGLVVAGGALPPAPGRPRTLVCPPPPQDRPTARFPLIAVLVPALAAALLALFLNSPTFLLFGLLSPIMLVANLANDKVLGRRRTRAELRAHQEELDRFRSHVRDLLEVESAARHHRFPDPDLLLEVLGGRGTRLWERGAQDPDHLRVRVGTGLVPADLQVRGPGEEHHRPMLTGAPVVLSLREAGWLGVSGPPAQRTALAAHLTAQVVVLHPPRSVRVVLLADPRSRPGWEWLRWVRACDPVRDLDPGTGALTGVDRSQTSRQVQALSALVRARAAGPDQGDRGPDVLVVVEAEVLAAAPDGLMQVLEQGPAVGVYGLVLAEDPAALPGACRDRVAVDLTGRLTCSQAGEAVADLPGPGWREAIGRGLAPLREVSGPTGTALPGQVSLGALWPHPLDAGTLARAWQTGSPQLRVPVGVGGGGPFTLDLVADGPHALVAGTTGAGKSELLRTLVCALALANPPRDVAFVLVDYKGGAAFGPCLGLPHVMGTVTDLDPAGTERVLLSLRAELHRRERAFAAAGVQDLTGYSRLCRDGDLPPLPRLVIVIDEFRMLATEQPALMESLVSLAALGRSLGLHLVLATQRPAGVVGQDIRANVNLRIALRVQDVTDSRDVLDDPAAATLDPSQLGRALVRTGPGPVTEIQVALAGAGNGPHPIRSHPFDLAALGRQRPGPEPVVADVAGLVALISRAVEQAGLSPAAPVWLPALPDRLAATAVPDLPDAVPLGLADHPAHQRQEPWGWAREHGNLLICGAPRSGRRTLLQTLLRGLAARPATAWVIDGAGGLGGEDHAHVGAVAAGTDGEHAERVLRHLAAVVQARTLAAQHDPDWQVLVLHGWEDVSACWEDPAWAVCADLLADVMRRGPAVGVSTVVTGGRAVFSGRIATTAGGRLLLRPADPTDAVLAGLSLRHLPGTWPPGRALVPGSPPTLVQLTLPPPRPARSMLRAEPVPALPQRVAATDEPLEPGWIGYGRGGPTASPVGWGTGGPAGLLVTGAAGTGRSTSLRALAGGAGAAGVRVVWIGTDPPAGAHVLAGHRPPPGQLEQVCAGALVLADDLDRLDPGWDPALAGLLGASHGERSGRPRVAVALTTQAALSRHSGVVAALRRGGHGLLLTPTGPVDGDLFGLRLARRTGQPAGRALLVDRGRVVSVQIRDVPIDTLDGAGDLSAARMGARHPMSQAGERS